MNFEEEKKLIEEEFGVTDEIWENLEEYAHSFGFETYQDLCEVQYKAYFK